MNTGEYTIPRKPLIWLAVALLFTTPPMFGNLAAWVPVSLMGVLLCKIWMEWKGERLRFVGWKVILAAAAAGGVYLTYHGLIGLEPGLSIYVLLISLKILEAHTARDFHVMALLGWFSCLGGLFISQSIGAGMYATVTFCLVLTSVVQFHRGNASGGVFLPPLRSSLGLVLQALPLMLLMFLLFPRGGGAFRFDLKRSFFGKTGMSDSLDPGSISTLAATTEVAFRVEFPDGNYPRSTDMYWRGGVLMECNGLSWSHPPPGPENADELTGKAIRQRIIMQPHGGSWIFALDWPSKTPKIPEGTRMLSGYVLRANKNIFSPRLYEVFSRAGNHQRQMSDGEKNTYLRVQRDLFPRAAKLAESWTENTHDSRAVVARAVQYFHKGNFHYTLSPGEYRGKDGLEEFLFHRRIGFCEHYAAAFATLMRLAHIPARVVMGYQGGQFNSLGSYLVVHQSDAHAWCEVWIPGSGWERVDPTAAVAPGRVDLGFDSFMGAAAATGAAGAADPHAASAWSRQSLVRKLQLAWDTVSYEWESHVLNFDEEAQQTFLLNLGIVDSRPVRLLMWLVMIVALFMMGQAFWSRSKMRVVPDPVRRLYGRFCKRMQALGLKREPWEGPGTFADRASSQLPAHSAGIRNITDLYISLRYAPEAGGRDAVEKMEKAVRSFGKKIAVDGKNH